MKFKIERADDGTYALLMLCPDSIVWDWLDSYPTKAAAIAAMRHEREEAATSAGAERHHQAQYDYACGYHD